MDKTIAITIVYGLAAAGANFAGGMLVSSRRLGNTALRYLIALGAGFMLAGIGLAAVADAGHEFPFYPSFYPQEITVEALDEPGLDRRSTD